MDEPIDEATWTVRTDVFEGPLDLLLFLVKRDGIDLRRLSLAKIADSYLAFLDRLRQLNLAVAGDWLVMAATLVHLKSLELLPRAPTMLADEEDPRAALVARLEAYQRYQEAAEAMEQRAMVGRDVFARPQPELEEHADRPLAASIDAFGLLELYYQLLTREPEVAPTVRKREVGLDFGASCKSVLEALAAGPVEFGSWLRGLASRAERVLAFVAALEMIRQGWLEVLQDHHLGAIQLSARTDLGAVDLTRVTGRAGLEAEAT